MSYSKKKIMKDIGLNDMITVTLPAHVWIGFIGAYTSTRWASEDATTITKEAMEQMLNPVVLKENEAAMEQYRDERDTMMRSLFTGRLGETPPHMEEEP